MRKVFLRILSVLAILSLLLGAAALYLDLHLYLRPIPSDPDAAIREQVEAAKVPGAMMMAVKDNQVVFSQGYGYANLEEKRPVTTDTTFQIASVSKLVTATA